MKVIELMKSNMNTNDDSRFTPPLIDSVFCLQLLHCLHSYSISSVNISLPLLKVKGVNNPCNLNELESDDAMTMMYLIGLH